MKELLISEVEIKLKTFGFNNIKRLSSRRTVVFVETSRLETLHRIDVLFKKLGSTYDPSFSGSSIGAVKIGEVAILVKSPLKQGDKSPGIANEHLFINMIRKYIKGSYIGINITDGIKSISHIIVGVEEVGRDTKNRKKSDVNLITISGEKVPISIKMDNAEIWESADSYYACKAKRIISREEKCKRVKLSQKGTVYRISPNIAAKARKDEKKDVVFGSDLLGSGFVLIRSFIESDFKHDGDLNTLSINASKILNEECDLKDDYDVYFLMRNDSTRQGSKIKPGIRVLAVQPSRITNNVKVVKGIGSLTVNKTK